MFAGIGEGEHIMCICIQGTSDILLIEAEAVVSMCRNIFIDG